MRRQLSIQELFGCPLTVVKCTKLRWHCPMPATTRPAHSHSHADGQAGAKPKLYNPSHPERTLLYQSIAEHFETWFELASCGQFVGQSDHHTPSLMSAKRFANIWSAASSRTALLGPGVTIVDTTTSWPIPAKAVASAPRAIPGAWWRRRHTSAIMSSPACRCASGCCRCRSGCATTCSVTGQCSTWC